MFDITSCKAFIANRIKRPGSWHAQDSSTMSLAAAVMAIKSAISLGMTPECRESGLGEFVESFRNEDGWFHDPSIHSMAHRLGETRQALAVLKSLGTTTPPPHINYDEELKLIDWKDPWGANARLSHLIYFSTLNAQHSMTDKLAEFFVTTREKDGLWGSRAISPSHRINGAMKVAVALQSAGRSFPDKKMVLRYLLGHTAPDDGCGVCDRAIVLGTCLTEATGLLGWRARREARKLVEMIGSRQREDGGFSFFKAHCQTHFYGEKISDPLPLSDLHGTHLMLWALAELRPYCPDLPYVSTPPI